MADAMQYFMALDRKSPAPFTDAEQRLLSSGHANAAAAAAATPKATSSCGSTPDSMQGRYSRADGKGVRLRWIEGENSHVKTYLNTVKSGTILGTMICVCAASGGETCIRSLTRKQVERAAEASFGERALGDDETILLKNHEAAGHWFSLVLQHRRVAIDTGLVTLHYHLDGMPVCRTAFRDAHGMVRSSFNCIEKKVLNGDSLYSESRPLARQKQPSEFFRAAVVWWIGMFRCFDQTTKHGKLMYEVRRYARTHARRARTPVARTHAHFHRSQPPSTPSRHTHPPHPPLTPTPHTPTPRVTPHTRPSHHPQVEHNVRC